MHFYKILDTTDVNSRYSGRYKGPNHNSFGNNFEDLGGSANYEAFWAVEIQNDYAIAGVYQDSAYIFKREGTSPNDYWVRDVYNGTDTNYFETINTIKYFEFNPGNVADHSESASIYGTDAFVTGGENPKSVYHFKRETDGWVFKQKIIKTDLVNAGVYSSGDKLSSQVWSKGTSIEQFCDNVLAANNWVFIIDTRGNSRKGYVHSYYKGTNGIYDISNVSLMAEGDNSNDDFGKVIAYNNSTLVISGGNNNSSSAYIKIYSLPLDGSTEVTTTTTVTTHRIRETLKITDKGDISGNDASFNLINGNNIYGSLTGNASTATALANTITIAGENFDGTSNISINTDNITEGSTNIFTTAARTRGHFTYGTGITHNAGELSIGQDVSTTSDVQFKDLNVTGNITFTGEATTINSTNTDISDNLIVLNSNFPSNVINTNDSGILIERGNADNAFMGWDESSDKFVFGTTTAIGTEIGDLTITDGTIKAATFEGNLTGNAATATTAGTVTTAAQPNITSVGILQV